MWFRISLFFVCVLLKFFYSPNKHGRRINNTNIIKTTQLQSRQKTLEGRFKFRHVWPIIHLVKQSRSTPDSTLQFIKFILSQYSVSCRCTLITSFCNNKSLKRYLRRFYDSSRSCYDSRISTAIVKRRSHSGLRLAHTWSVTKAVTQAYWQFGWQKLLSCLSMELNECTYKCFYHNLKLVL